MLFYKFYKFLNIKNIGIYAFQRAKLGLSGVSMYFDD